MARPKNKRKMVAPPKFKGFKPYGYYAKEQKNIILLFEEYETVRLCDYELLTQLEAAKFMGISRPTLTRIYESARRKISKAFVEARAIVIEGGRVYFDDEWYNCKKCGSYFNNPKKEKEIKKCLLCNSIQISKIKETINNE